MREHIVIIADTISLEGLFFMQQSKLVTFTTGTSFLYKRNNITCSRYVMQITCYDLQVLKNFSYILFCISSNKELIYSLTFSHRSFTFKF
jgi:hypothetical protein